MSAFDASKRDRLVIIENVTKVRDAYGDSVETWAEVGREMANVRYGSGAERRQAAQVSASETATFGMLFNSLTASLTTRHRLTFEGSAWDIQQVVKAHANSGVVVTAIRAA